MWALLQGIFLPGPVDLFFLPLALAARARAYRLALISCVGSVAGSTILFLIASTSLTWLEGSIASLFDISPASMAEMRALLSRWGALVLVASVMTPISTKLTVVVSGAAGMPFLRFLLAITSGRALRNLVIAVLIRNGGAQAVERWVSRSSG